jgi:hypothetical protein
MFTLWFQSLLEWAFRQTYLTVQFFMLAGFLATLARIDKQMVRDKKLEIAKHWALAQWWHNLKRGGPRPTAMPRQMRTGKRSF